MPQYTLSDHIERSLSLYRSHFLTYSKYIGLSVIPSIIQYIAIIGVSFVSLTSILHAYQTQSLSFGNIILPTILTIIVNMVIGLFALWITIAFQRTIYATMQGQPTGTLRERLREATSRFLPTLGTSILYTIYAVGPILLVIALWALAFLTDTTRTPLVQILLIIGSAYGIFHLIYMTIRLFFALFEVILHGTHIREAFHISWQLTKNNFWYIFLALAVTGIAISIVLGILDSVLTAVSNVIPSTIDDIIINIIMIVLSYFLYQVITLVSISLYDGQKNPPTERLETEFTPEKSA